MNAESPFKLHLVHESRGGFPVVILIRSRLEHAVTARQPRRDHTEIPNAEPSLADMAVHAPDGALAIYCIP